MDANGCVALPYATTACFGANLEQCRLLHSARDHATIDCVSLVRRVSTVRCKKPAPFLLQSTHTHTAESRACGGLWSHLCLVGTPQWGRTHGTQAAKGTEEKRALLVLVKWARVYTAHAIRYGNTQAALCFFVRRRATLKKNRACGALAGGCPQTPLEPEYHYC